MPAQFKSSHLWVRCLERPDLPPLRIHNAARVAKCHNGTLYRAVRLGIPINGQHWVRCEAPQPIDFSDLVVVPEKTRMPVVERDDEGLVMPINPWRR